jgi:methanogenic corrinoid protein MtbC1
VYPLSIVPRLRRVAQALARGHRAAEVLPASESDLEALLAAIPQSPIAVAPPASSTSAFPSSEVTDQAELLDATREFDAERLKRLFQTEWARLGPLGFLTIRAAPFLTAVGNAWADGSLDVRHEHFASAVLGDFLRAVRQPLDDRASGPLVVLATMPDELHGLGLQMAAVVFALAGWRTLVLGVDTPVAQIVALAREAPIAAVALSCVQPRGRNVTAAIRALRRKLPRRVALLVGGTGAPTAAHAAGIEIMPDLEHLDHWLRLQSAR